MSRIDEFKLWLIEDEKSKNTIDAYLYAVRTFFDKYDEVTKANTMAYKNDCLELYSHKTANLRCTAINQYCKFIGKPECCVKQIKCGGQTFVENVISKEQYKTLVDYLAEAKDWRTYWLVQYLAKTGARASEIVRFEKKHLKAGVAILQTKGKVRRILIPESLITESEGYFDSRKGDYLFPGQRAGHCMTTRGLDGILKRAGAACGIPKDVMHAHSFRHYYAIRFLECNNNIALLADLMGHESVSTTAIYLRLTAKEQARQLNSAMNW